MSDVEQPLPATFNPEYKDEPDWTIEQARHHGYTVGAHYKALIANGVPPKRAERLTATWMELNADDNQG